MKPYVVFPLLVSLLLVTGCVGRSATQEPESSDNTTTSTNELATRRSNGEPLWYWFSEEGIHYAANPADIPYRPFVPWTEAVRAVDAAMINASPALLINRLGIMSTVTGTPTLHTDPALFPALTAAGLYRTGELIAVRLYRNSFFSDSIEAKEGTFLATFNPAEGTFSRFLSATDLGLPAEAQCVALDRIGSMWYASFKWDSAQKVEFAYLEFDSFPVRNSAGSLDLSSVRRIDNSTYQVSVSPFSFRNAPEQLKHALESLPLDMALSVRLYSRSTASSQKFIREGSGTPIEGSAFVSDDRTAVLFADGTFYYLADNASGAVTVLKLPALSGGYVYTSFILSNSTLIAAWEEQRFFETGRAGLLEIPLAQGYN